MDADRWARVKALFEAVVEQPPERREAFLAEACGGDLALRDEVASLVAHHRSDEFLALPAAAEPDLESEIGLVGRRLGSYEVVARLGRGGMGVVYLARDLRLERLVAIKLVAPEAASDPQRRARLVREARAAATLSHPGIATVYALEEVGHHLLIVSEYIRGETLREELARGPLPLERLVDTALGVARALAAAHAHGIVHRDLKPENVMRAIDGQVKILDFGLARAARPGVATSATDGALTAPGSLVGTPAYMAPEQLRAEPVDFRADLFAFGVLVHELAAGVHPFGGADPVSTMARIVSDEPPALETQAMVPRALSGVVDRCLRKSPDERYAATTDLVADLERIRRELGGSGDGGPAAPYRFEAAGGSASALVRWWQVHQLAVGLAPCALLWPLWAVQGSLTGPSGLALFIPAAGAAAALVTLRAHLWFTSRFSPGHLARQHRRARPWIWLAEGLFLGLLFLGAAAVAPAHRALAALLAFAGVTLALVSAIVEPATTRAAFGDLFRRA